MPRVWSFVSEYSMLLISGAILALLWASFAPFTYHHFVDFEVFRIGPAGHLHDDGHGHVTRSFTLHSLVSDVLMAVLLTLAGKAVWEAIATAGGMFGFAVARFVAPAAVAPGRIRDAAKNGAFLSFGAAILSFVSGRCPNRRTPGRSPMPARPNRMRVCLNTIVRSPVAGNSA